MAEDIRKHGPGTGGTDNDDLWAQLLGAAQTEAAKEQEATGPKEESEDPWAQLLGAAEKHIADRGNSPAGSDAPFAKGSMLLDTYRIESDTIGNGGMGDVWRVHHTLWNVDLAMKRPKPELFATESAKQGFIDECRHWINLGLHPNIVSCYYVREIDGVPTIFSEWMENGDLEHHIQSGTLYDGNEEEVRKRLLDIAIQYARGLRYAHEQGLIHQDVKPANLLLTNDWQAKAADFGLANARAQLTVLEGDVTRQDPGQSLNAAAGGYTPAYCSMEQLDGKTLTRRTDIYSWAVSVMEMYYGSRPWANGAVAGAGCRDYMAASDCRISIPERLQDLLARCMEMDADNRPHDFGIVETELKEIWRDSFGEDYFRPEPEAAPDTADSLNNRALSYLDLGMPEKAEAFWRQALIADPSNIQTVFNSSLFAMRQGKINPGEAENNIGLVYLATGEGMQHRIRLDLEIGPEAYGSVRERLPRHGTPALKQEAEEAMRSGSYTCRWELSRIRELPDIIRQEQKFDKKKKEIRAMMERGEFADAAIALAGITTEDPDFSHCIYRPDWMSVSEQLGSHGFPFEVKGQFRLMTIPEATPFDDVSFSDDSRRLLCGGRLYDLQTGELLADHRPGNVRATFSRLSPDGTFLLRGRHDRNDFEKIDALTGETLGRYEGFRDHMAALAISPDGTTVAGCDMNCEFRMWTGSEEIFHFCLDLDPISRMWIGPENRRLLFANWNYNRVSLLQFAGRQYSFEQLDNIVYDDIHDISVSTDFTKMVVSGGRQGFTYYDLERRRTILRSGQTDDAERIRKVLNAVMLPSNRSFAYVSSGQVMYYHPAIDRSFGVFGAATEIVKLSVSRNWKYLAFMGADGKFGLIRTAYTWYVAPASSMDPEGDRVRFYSRRFAEDIDGPLSREEKEFADRKLREYEALFNDPSVPPAYAHILRNQNPHASPESLLPRMMTEMAERGHCLFSEEDALRVLRQMCMR